MTRRRKWIIGGVLAAAFAGAGFWYAGHQGPTPAPQPGPAAHETKTADDPSEPSVPNQYAVPIRAEFMMTVTGDVTTKDNRRLTVTSRAYCKSLTKLAMDEYRRKCAARTMQSVEYFARDRDRFEGALPVANPAIRKNALFTEQMMRETLEISDENADLYTVIDIRPAKP
jgi:hypothetical protein